MNDEDLRTLLARRAEELDVEQPGQLGRLHARISAARRRRTVGALAAVLVAAGLVSILGPSSGNGNGGAPVPIGPAHGPAERTPPGYREVPTTGAGEGPGLEPGRWALSAEGHSPDTVLAELDLPAGYDGTSWFVGSDDLAVLYWVVDQVPADPCLERGRRDPGPTVADLARALDRQRLTRVLHRRPVTLGGHRGIYLEIVAPDVDYSSCKEGQVWYWESPTDGARHHGGPAGDVERVWIVDVDGQRVVLDGDVAPRAPAGTVAELRRVVGSVRFVQPR